MSRVQLTSTQQTPELIILGAFYSAFGSMIMEIGYGLKVKDEHDRYLALEEEVLQIFLQAFVPGKYLVETFRFLRHIPDWMPGARFKRDAAQWKETAQATRNLPFEATLESMVGLRFGEQQT